MKLPFRIRSIPNSQFFIDMDRQTVEGTIPGYQILDAYEITDLEITNRLKGTYTVFEDKTVHHGERGFISGFLKDLQVKGLRIEPLNPTFQESQSVTVVSNGIGSGNPYPGKSSFHLDEGGDICDKVQISTHPPKDPQINDNIHVDNQNSSITRPNTKRTPDFIIKEVLRLLDEANAREFESLREKTQVDAKILEKTLLTLMKKGLIKGKKLPVTTDRFYPSIWYLTHPNESPSLLFDSFRQKYCGQKIFQYLEKIFPEYRSTEEIAADIGLDEKIAVPSIQHLLSQGLVTCKGDKLGVILKRVRYDDFPLPQLEDFVVNNTIEKSGKEGINEIDRFRQFL